MTDPGPDEIAACILSTFAALPQKYKPRTLPSGQSEWVPLAGIVLSRAHRSEDHGTPPHLLCAALATGMKCLPHSKLPLAKGNVLHDWHAEVLALRAFNRFLIDECAELARQGRQSESKWVEWQRQEQISREGTSSKEQAEIRQTEQAGQRYTPPFTLRPDVHIHMYCSETPCGDASMELTMASQSDATPWSSSTTSSPSTSPPTSPPTPPATLLGRAHFDRLSLVRRKPSRPDAPPTLSKSCSDKLALKQCTGLLSAPTSLLLDPSSVYLDTLILPESQHVDTAVSRAFGRKGRMKELGREDVQARWSRRGGFTFRPFAVKTTKRDFECSRRSPATTARGGAQVSSNLSAMYTPGRREILINGVLQGRKQLDPKAASCVSRRMVWKSVLDVAMLAGIPLLTEALGKKRSYAEMKGCEMLEGRERVKKDVKEMALQGWVRNEGDEGWELDE